MTDSGREGAPGPKAAPAAEAVGHLQSAALEVIAAVRSFLDAAEAVVKDPAGAASVASTLAGKARRRPSGTGTDDGDGEDDGDEGDGDDGRVERIPVS